MSANERQVGGDFWKKITYQHWDWVTDIRLHYLLGCASKYLVRWRDKNGVEDLRKALHYLDKAIERDVTFHTNGDVEGLTLRFVAQLPPEEGMAIAAMTEGRYYKARDIVSAIIDVA